MREMKCALIYRGICRGKNLHPQTNTYQYIDYKSCIQSIKNNLINLNKEVIFDVYAHGWIDDTNIINEINDIYKPINSKFELQKNFLNFYKNISNYSSILKERYCHLIKNKDIQYFNDINFQNYFQSIFSYAYSIAESVSLVDKDYDLAIFLRYDCELQQPVILNQINPDIFYTDNVGLDHSPIFYGDFLAISNLNNIKKFKTFFEFLQNEIFNNKKFISWVDRIRNCKALYNPRGRYNHGIYSNQVIYSYFLNHSGINYINVLPKYKCGLKKYKL